MIALVIAAAFIALCSRVAVWSLQRASACGDRLGGYLGPEPDVWCGLAEVDRDERNER